MIQNAVRYYVLFNSSFRYKYAPNISHETIDQQRTLCGRKVSDAETLEPDSNNLLPNCIVCRRARARISTSASRPKQRDTEEEAQLVCSSCSSGHELGRLRSPCRTTGCQCWCNR